VTGPPDKARACVDTVVCKDGAGDASGIAEDTMTVCLRPGEQPPDGYATMAGDCNDADPLQYAGAAGVCGDNVDDDCDEMDEACPETLPADQPGMQGDLVWDCQGTPPDFVYAFARMTDGGEYFKNQGCFVFYETSKDAFFVQRANIERLNPCPGERYGCTCPSLNGWSSFDRRLYAFTLQGTPDECAELALIDHAGEEQPVSNACRKYLYQMHRYDIPYSYIASSEAELDRRLELYSTVEIACMADNPHRNLPFASLVTMQIERNPGFKKK